jgi:hypothetical protein
LADLGGGGFRLLALDAQQKALEFLVGKPGMQDTRENDGQGDHGDEGGGVFIEKPAARDSGNRRCFISVPAIKHVDNHGFLPVPAPLSLGYRNRLL